MGNIVHCCRTLSDYFQRRDDAPGQTEERSPLLSSDEEGQSPCKIQGDPTDSPTLDQDHLLFPDIVLSSSLGAASLDPNRMNEETREKYEYERMTERFSRGLNQDEPSSQEANCTEMVPPLRFSSQPTKVSVEIRAEPCDSAHLQGATRTAMLCNRVQLPPGGEETEILSDSKMCICSQSSKPLLTHTKSGCDSIHVQQCEVQMKLGVKETEHNEEQSPHRTEEIMQPLIFDQRSIGSVSPKMELNQNEPSFIKLQEHSEVNVEVNNTTLTEQEITFHLGLDEENEVQVKLDSMEIRENEEGPPQAVASSAQHQQNPQMQGNFDLEESDNAQRDTSMKSGLLAREWTISEPKQALEWDKNVLLEPDTVNSDEGQVYMDSNVPDLDEGEREHDASQAETSPNREGKEPDEAPTKENQLMRGELNGEEMERAQANQGETEIEMEDQAHFTLKQTKLDQEPVHQKLEQNAESVLQMVQTGRDVDQNKHFTLFVVDKLFLATHTEFGLETALSGRGDQKTTEDRVAGQNGCCDEGDKQDEDQNNSVMQDMSYPGDTDFSIKIQAPGTDLIDLQVSPLAVVQEIKQVLMDLEDTCQRTCFSLQMDGSTLDNFMHLKSIPTLQEGSLIKVVEEPYTIRELRIHLRHIRNLLKSLDHSDAYNGINGNSLSFLSLFTDENGDERAGPKKQQCHTPPEHIVPGSKQRLLGPLQPQREDWKPIECVRMLTMSNWNPPPGNRKMHGDLMYLDLVTMENKLFSVTASTRGFYLNQSTTYIFNPKPANPSCLSHSLTDLLSQSSPTFKRNFSALLKKRALSHNFERVPTPYQLFSWAAPALDHCIDCIRAEDANSSHLGHEEHVLGQTRDWNEELQSTRELPRKTLSNRLQRSRVMFKVNSDFVTAATHGAMAVIDGNVMPINPSEEPRHQMFIWNNIFFSLGFDVQDHYKKLGGDAAAHAAASLDMKGVQAYSDIDAEGLYLLGTVVVDYRGYRVTAQSIVPGILERDQQQSVIYGSINFGKTVITCDRYLELLDIPSQKLRIQRHQVLNEDGQTMELCSSVECKGVVGNDGRHYILDLLHTFPPDPNFLPVDGEEMPQEIQVLGFPRHHPHRFACLRQELIEAFVEHRQQLLMDTISQCFGQENKTNRVIGITQEEILKKSVIFTETKENVTLMTQDDKLTKFAEEHEISDTSRRCREIIKNAKRDEESYCSTLLNIRFNPNVFSEGVCFPKESVEDVREQRQLLGEAASFLLAHQIPSLIKNCLDHSVVPMDGITLTEALHQHGINVRYLGNLLYFLESMAQKDKLDHIYRISLCELITRCAKHLFKTYLLTVKPPALSAAVSHFLNCFLTSAAEARGGQQSDKPMSRRKSRRQRSCGTPWASLTAEKLWRNIQVEAQEYYHYSLPCDSVEYAVEKYRLQKITLLREIAIKTGIQVLNREYHFDSKNKPIFTEEDVLNIFPVVKHISPKSTDGLYLLRCGQIKVQQGCLKEGCELITQALSFCINVYGPLHQDVCTCLRLLGRIHYILSDYAQALVHQQKAVLMSERVLGIEHPNTIQEYMHLGLYCFANGQSFTALKLLYRARYLMLLLCGEDHPEVAVLDTKIGLVLFGMMEWDLSLRFLENSLTLNIKYHGPLSLKLAQSHHLLAKVYEAKGKYRSALRHEKDRYTIYISQVGETHDKTQESSEYLKHLTQQAVLLQRTMNMIFKNAPDRTITPLHLVLPSQIWILEQLNLITGIVLIPLSDKDLENLMSDAQRAPQPSDLTQKMETDKDQ